MLGALAFFSMKHSIHATVDEQLQDRMNAVRQAVENSLRKGDVETLRSELDEDSELRPQTDLLQVWDDQRRLIYQSASLKSKGLPPPVASLRRWRCFWLPPWVTGSAERHLRRWTRLLRPHNRSARRIFRPGSPFPGQGTSCSGLRRR